MANSNDAHHLLQMLASDDNFRAALQADPVGTLAQFGIEVNSTDLPQGGVRLPSKEDVSRNMAKMEEDLKTEMAIFLLQA